MVGGERKLVAIAKGVGELVIVRLGKIELKPGSDIFRSRPTPFIDALIDIADDHDPGPVPGQDF